MKNKTVKCLNRASIALVYFGLIICTFSCKNNHFEPVTTKNPNDSALEEIQRMRDEYLGILTSQPTSQSTSSSKANAIAESYVDLTAYFPNVGDQDQDHIGSCVSYACSYAKGFQENYERGLQGTNRKYTMSAINLFARVMSTSNACIFAGSSFTDNFNQLRDYGICLEEDLPYDANKCIAKNDSRINLYYWANFRFRISGYNALSLTNSLSSIKTSLANNQPVILGISVDKTFRYYKGNGLVYTHNYNPSEAIFGHGICCIGYNPTNNSYKLINSYGVNWGDGGYIWISEAALLTHLFAAYTLNDEKDTEAGVMICPVREIASSNGFDYRMSSIYSSSEKVAFKAFDGKNGNADYIPIYAKPTSPGQWEYTTTPISTGRFKMFYTKKNKLSNDNPQLDHLYYITKNGYTKLSKTVLPGTKLVRDLGYVIW